MLSYHGGIDNIGVTTAAPRVYLVIWGSQWGTASTGSDGYTHLSGDTQSIVPRLQAMYAGLGTNGEQWSGVMTQYCEGVAAGTTSCPAGAAHVAYPSGEVLAGIWVDGSAAAPANAIDNQIAVEAVTAAGHFGNTTAASNRDAQYIVVSPPGTHPGGFNTPSGNFCAWHDYNADPMLAGGPAASSYGDIAFTNLPYVTDMGASCGTNYVNAGAAGTLDGVTIIGGHEYAETITDQNAGGGWYDAVGYENADKCAWVGVGGTGGAQNVSFATGAFAMQATFANDTNRCQITHAVVGSNAAPVVTMNPLSQTATAGQSVTFTVGATGVPAPTVQVAGLDRRGLHVHEHHGRHDDDLHVHGRRDPKRQPVPSRVHQHRRVRHHDRRHPHRDVGTRRHDEPHVADRHGGPVGHLHRGRDRCAHADGAMAGLDRRRRHVQQHQRRDRDDATRSRPPRLRTATSTAPCSRTPAGARPRPRRP